MLVSLALSLMNVAGQGQSEDNNEANQRRTGIVDLEGAISSVPSPTESSHFGPYQHFQE